LTTKKENKSLFKIIEKKPIIPNKKEI